MSFCGDSFLGVVLALAVAGCGAGGDFTSQDAAAPDTTCPSCVPDSAVIDDLPIPPDGFEACASSSGVVEVGKPAVDIIWVIDSSGSMSQENSAVQANLNAFATFMGSQSIDYHVIVIGKQDICVPPPLGGPGCTDGPNYKHVVQSVGSKNALELVIDTYPQWQGFLRAGAATNFIAVSDDNSKKSPSWFMSQIGALTNPGFPIGFTFHSIVAFGPIPFIGCITGAGFGQVYLDLTALTGGLQFEVCSGDWSGMFNSLAVGVANTARPPCEYAIPEPGGGEEVNPDQVTVSHDDGPISTPIEKRADASQCGAGGWHFDDPVNPTTVVLCESTCEGISSGEIKVDFGCLQPIL